MLDKGVSNQLEMLLILKNVFETKGGKLETKGGDRKKWEPLAAYIKG